VIKMITKQQIGEKFVKFDQGLDKLLQKAPILVLPLLPLLTGWMILSPALLSKDYLEEQKRLCIEYEKAQREKEQERKEIQEKERRKSALSLDESIALAQRADNWRYERKSERMQYQNYQGKWTGFEYMDLYGTLENFAIGLSLTDSHRASQIIIQTEDNRIADYTSAKVLPLFFQAQKNADINTKREEEHKKAIIRQKLERDLIEARKLLQRQIP
jgi:hypothetical protein